MKPFLPKSGIFAFVFLIANLFFVNVAFGQRFAVSTGNWNGAIWATTAGGAAGSAATPTASDAVTINSGVTVTVNVTANCASLDFLSTASNNSTVSISSGITLTVVGTITIPRQGSNNNTMAVGAGILNAANIAFTNGGGGQRHFLTISTGTVTVTGNVTQSGSSGSATITFSGAGLLKLGGTFLTSGTATFTASTGTVEYNAAGAQTIGDFTYNNLTTSGSGIKTLAASSSANGILTVKAGTTLALSTFNLGSPTSTVLECGATTASSITGTGTLTLGGNVTVNNIATGSSGATIASPVALGSTRTFTVANDGTAASDLSMNGIISGGGSGITKAGLGTLTFSAANTYTGATTITAGELKLNPTANTTPNTQIVLNGGKLSTIGITATRTITNSSTLNLNANSTIDLESNNHSLKFANSNGVSWAGTTLTINNWTGVAGSSSTGGKIFFGAATGTLTAAQLGKISFTGFSGTPILLSTGELIPPLNVPVLAITGTTGFGTTCIGTPATTITYTITNSGTTASDIAVVSNNSQFVVSNLSSTTINGSGGTATYQVTFTPSSSGPQNATITVTSSTVGSNSPTSSLTGTGAAQPTASAGGSQTICSSGTATVSGALSSNGTILWTHNGTGTINNATTLTPSYTPTLTDANTDFGNGLGIVTLTMTVSNSNCVPATALYHVTVQTGPSVDAGVDRTVCSSSPNVSLAGSVTGSVDSGTWSSNGTGTFSPDNTTLGATYIPSAADITAGTVTLTLSSFDPYQDPTNFPCYTSVSDQMIITIKAVPTATAGGSQSICPSSSATVSGATSSNGTILWTHNGGGSLSNATTLTPTYTPVAGDAVTNYGNGIGVVTLTMTVSNSPCNPASATYSVTVNPLPINKSLIGTATICSGSTTIIQVDNSEIGVQYQLRNNSNNALMGAPVAGNGGTINLPTDPLASTTTFNVLATNMTTSCSLQMSGTITITVNPAPVDRTVGPTTPPSICSGSTTNITVTASTNSTTTYQLRNDADNSLVGPPVTGNGGTINLPTGILTNNTSSPIVITYNVLATITATGCTAKMAITKAVTVSPIISNNIISADQSICSGATPVALTGVPTGGNGTYTYGWSQSTDNFVGNNNNASTANGSRTAQNYSPPSLTQTMWYRRTVSSGACANDTSPSVKITVNPLPTIFAVTGGGAYCAGGLGMPIGLSNSQTNINYQLFLGASPNGSPVAGTGSAITFGNKTAAGTYTVVASDAVTNCSSNMTGSATITVNPVPTTVGASVCLGGSGSLSSPTICPPGTATNTPSTNAGTGTNVGTVAWQTPGNIVSDNSSNATVTSATAITTGSLQGTNYGFAIPANAIINGIQVSINRNATSALNAVQDNSVRLIKAGTIVGTSNAIVGNWSTTATTVATYGGVSDLWGTTWTPAEINDPNFGIALTANLSFIFGTAGANVDYMQITVSYSFNGVINWYTASSGGTSIGTGSPFNPVGVLNSTLANTNTAGTTPFYAECSSVPGCRTVANFVVLPLPTVNVSKTNVSCHGLADGTITISGVSAGATTIIQLNGTGPDLSAQTTFAPGTYVITASKPNGSEFCTSTVSVTITEPITVTVNASKTNVSCHGLADGTISINGLSAGATTTIQLNGAGSDLSAQTTFAPGTYLITASAPNGNANGFCTATASVTITEPIQVTVNASKTNVSCNGLANGTISISGLSAGATTIIQLNGIGSDLSAQTTFAPGTYLITASAPNGNANGFCTATASVTITEPIQVTVSASKTNVSCNGLADGTISISGLSAGATTTIQLNGSGPDLSAQTSFASGTYLITASATNGNANGFCTATASVTITEPIQVTVSASKTNVSCHGLADGTITISGLSAGATTTIQLDGSGPDLSAQTSFAPGTYLITASAPNGNADGFCTATASVTITEPIQVTVNASATNVSCNGLANGTITISGLSAGATTTIQLDGSGPDLSAQTTFAPGTYLITASAPNGNTNGFCTATASVTITEPIAITVNASKTNVSCNGTADGTITISGLSAGATTTIQLDGSGPDLSAQTTFAPGTYVITATAPNGNADGFCTATASVTITEPVQVAVNASKTNVSCNGLADGTITISGLSAGATTTIQLDGTGPDLSAQTTFAPGTYLITATAPNGNADGFCTATASVTITEPIEVTVSASKTNVSCNGLADGTISVSGLSAGATTTIQLDGSGPDLSAQTTFAPGTYLITASAPNGNADGFCTATASVTITEPIAITVNASKTNVSCNGLADGTISISGLSAGATTTIQLDGSGPDLSAQTTFAPGTYLITATAPNGNTDGFCTATASVTITEPIQVTVNASKTNVSCNGLADGTISISGLSAGATTTIQLDGSGPDLSAQTTFAPGTYLITASAPNGNADGFCTATATVTITEPIEVTVNASATNVSCNGAAYGTITISGLSAGATTTIQLDGSGPDLSAQTTFAPGTYLITATAPNGNADGFCTATASVTITEPIEVTINASKTNVSCNGLADGTITISGLSAGATTTIQLDGSGPDLSAQTTFAPGTYLITATAPNGNADGFCTATASVTITEPIQVTVSASKTNVSCNGLADGTITISGLSAGATTTIQLDGSGPDLSAQTTFASGTYLITATAPNGNADGFCTATASVTITEPIQVTVNASKTNVSCNGTADGTITISGLSAGATTTIQLDGSGPDLSAQTTFAPGTYLITASAPNGNADGFCTATASVTITEPIQVTVNASGTNVSCNGSAYGTITISGLSAGATTTIQLDGAGPDLSAQTTFAPGTYLITATAPNGNTDGFCTATASVTITEPIEVTVNASATNVSCNGAADGTITISGLSAGATTTIQLDGSGPDLSAQTSFASGTYVITASAPNGNADGFCTSTTSVTITEPAVLTASITAQTNVDCFGNNNASATVTPTGGTSEYTYLWDDGLAQTNATATNLTTGTYHVTVTDDHGCTTSATATIIVADSELPTVITQNTDAELNASGNVTITVSMINNGSHDNCAIQSISVSPSTFTCANVGPNPVTLTVTDTNGNVNSGTATVTVKDLIVPVILGMPANKTVTLGANSCTKAVGWTPPTATDNCGIASLLSSDDDYNTFGSTSLSAGVHTITYTAIDVNGNSSNASFTVTVLDNILPTITGCPSNMTVNTDSNICGARAFYLQPTASDNCTGVSMSINNNNYLSGNIFPVGTTTVLWTATDASNNTASCSFTVTVEDHQAPVPTIAALPTVTSECSATVTTPTALDNCDGTINGVPNAPTAYNTPGTYTITWTYTDSHGNSSSQNQTVNVTATPPVINTQPISLTKCEGQSATFSVSATSATGYQWEVNAGGGWGNLDLETNSSLNFASVTNEMNGNQFRVTVKGSCGDTVSNVVTLTVNSLPSVNDQANQTLCNTSSFTMTQSGSGTWTLVSGSATITTPSSPTTTITAVAVGTSATVRWTVGSGSCSAFDDVIVTNRILPSVTDQPNQSLCNTSSFTMTQSVPSIGTGTWTLISGSAAITTASSPTTTITGVAVGTSATVRWTVTNIDCNTFDEVIVTNTASPTVSDQPNQSLCNTSSFTMTQSGSGTWTLVSGSATITTASSSTTTITGVAIGTSATVRWTVGSGPCSVFDDVTVTNTALPTVSDQPNQSLCNTSSFTMTQTGTGTWTLISGSATITTASSPTTTITGVAVGTSATVRWTTGSGACSAFDDVTVTNTALPTVSNQPNQSLCNTSSFTMTQTGTGTWTLISGSATITTASSPTTTITGVAVGTSATVRWTTGSGACSAFDDVTVTNTASPTVSNQPNQSLCNTSSFTMTQTGTGTWTLISGSATITTASSPTTTITGVAVGTSATVRWTTGSGACTAFDDVTVTNTALPTVSNQPNQSLCNTSSFTMTQSGSGTWTLVSGSATITTASSPTTTITGVAVGTSATVRWTTGSGACTAFDDVTVTNTASPTVSNQPNQSLCNTSSFTMTQSGTGTWTLVSGSATITTASSPTTTITGVAVGTSATVRWTTGSGACTAFDDVTVTNTASPTVSNQPNQSLCNTSGFTMTQTGTGTWTLVSGSATITTASSPTTTITGVAVGTSATVRWTVGSGACSAFDDVTVTNTASPTVSNQPNQSLCNTSGFTMTQSGSGTWTLVSGSATITTASSPTTTITGVAVGTSATVRWTVGSGACSAFDDVTVTNNSCTPFTASIAVSSPNAFCSGLTLTANTSVAGSYSYLWSPGGATTQSITLYNSASVGTYTVTVTKIGSGNTAQASYNFQPQNVINAYTILGFSEVNLGNGNFIQTGSVGATAAFGYVKIGTNSTVAGPGAFAKARYITVQPMSNVPVRIYSPVTVTLPTMQPNTSSTTGLSDLNIPNNTTVTKVGNYKNVTIGTNCNVTFTTGTIFGTVTIGKSSQVKFNANNTGILNVQSINMADGTDPLPSKLIFASDVSVRVKNNVTIGKSSMINPTGGYKAVFYVGGSEFHVLSGGNVAVNASVYAPNGTIRVEGDASKNTNMKGFYIADKVNSTNKNIYWNQFDCLNPTAKTNDTESIATREVLSLASPEPTPFDVKAYPNPTNYQFTIEVEGDSTEKVQVDVFDMQGRSIKHIESIDNQTIMFGEDLAVGTYIAIVNQGANKKTVKLIKK